MLRHAGPNAPRSLMSAGEAASSAGRTPSISVVMPVYNEPEWIVRSVSRIAEEVRGSRWTDPEIVVVDDGSTDCTSAVLDHLAASVPMRVIHQVNRGRFEARRTGLVAARGDYVLFIDARSPRGCGVTR